MGKSRQRRRNSGRAAGGTSFTTQNSAVLNGEQAQIFCGSFQAGDQSQTPTAVTLHFSWNVIFASQASSSVGTDTADTAAWSSVLDTTSSATSTVSTTPDTSVATSTPTSSSSSAPAVASSTPPTSTTTLDATPPASSSSTTDQSGTSLLQKMWSNPFAFLVERSFADTAGTASTTDVAADTSTATSTIATPAAPGDFMDVSYSLDGTTWIDLGQVSESDWQNYSVTIPVSSWSDINTLQVQLSPDIGPDEPTVSLDSMWLEVDYNQSILGDLEDVASATINAVSNLSDSVDNALTDLLTPVTTSTPQRKRRRSPVRPPLRHPHSSTDASIFFYAPGCAIHQSRKARVGPENVSGSAPVAGQTGLAPTVSLPATNTIQISGTCSAAYYTIIIFPDATDYEYNPSLAVYNEANKCVGGTFTQTISDLDLPPQLATGTYYLIVANQGTKGPWVPDPEIYPITFGDAPSSTPSSQ